MTSKGYAEYDPMVMGVKIALVRDMGQMRQHLTWEQPAVVTVTEADYATQPDDKVWLRLPDDDARALYEALADHFGHAGHDIRSLRKDYDAERGRVDQLIDHLTRKAAQ